MMTFAPNESARRSTRLSSVFARMWKSGARFRAEEWKIDSDIAETDELFGTDLLLPKIRRPSKQLFQEEVYPSKPFGRVSLTPNRMS